MLSIFLSFLHQQIKVAKKASAQIPNHLEMLTARAAQLLFSGSHPSDSCHFVMQILLSNQGNCIMAGNRL